MGEKINKSFLTEEAKSDINEMLDNSSGGGGSFTTQIETSEGLTLGKGTEDEESLSANELTELKAIDENMKVVTTTSDALTIASGFSNIQVKVGFSVTGLKPNQSYNFIPISFAPNSGSGESSIICSLTRSSAVFTTNSDADGKIIIPPYNFTVQMNVNNNNNSSINNVTFNIVWLFVKNNS